MAFVPLWGACSFRENAMPIRHLHLWPHHGPRTAFVLGGGGNLGAVQVGMLRALLERDIRPDVLIGCSVGALNAAAMAGDPSLDGVARLERIWLGLDANALFGSNSSLSGFLLLARRRLAMQPNDGMRQLVESALPYRTFEEARVPLHVVATSLRTGRETWFSSGPVIEPILASAALPGVFPPVELDGDVFIDGGVVDNVPMSRAFELRTPSVYVLHPGNFSRPRPQPRRPVDVLLQAFSIARNHRFFSEADAAPDGVELVKLPAVDPGNLRYNDFRRSGRLGRLGDVAGWGDDPALDELRGLIYEQGWVPVAVEESRDADAVTVEKDGEQRTLRSDHIAFHRFVEGVREEFHL